MGLAPLDQKTQAVLDGILAKDISALTPADKAFLKARAQYVGRRSRERFQSVFTEELPKQDNTAAEAEQASAAIDEPFDQETDDGEDEA